MTPDILVAVDIVDGHVVRLFRGEMDQATVYHHDPAEIARDWERQGARWLHVVDLDAATGSGRDNSAVIRRILKNVKIPVEVGGGVRSIDAIRLWIEAGAARVCIGTKSMDSEFLAEAVSQFGDKLVVSIDAREGMVRVGGWTEASGQSVAEVSTRVEQAGAKRIMFTDIGRDGTLEGPNLEAINGVLDSVAVPVIASGGVTSAQDVIALSALAGKGLEGIVIGRALYSGAIKLDDALAAGETR